MVFNVFNLGTSHSRTEKNNTMTVLYEDVDGQDKWINDGPMLVNAITGFGLDSKCKETLKAIKKLNPLPTRVIMTGHSRGACLCHMLAHYLVQNLPCGDKHLDQKNTSNIEIAMMVIDPVLQSKAPYEGAEGLDNSPQLLKYHAIIMENENSKLMGGPGKVLYPFKFVQTDTETASKVYYINMPGKHGSGTQPLTSAIGKVTMELIRNFMINVGTKFKTARKPPYEMCVEFAKIHQENPKIGGSRKIFDDKSSATVHNFSSKSWQPTTTREDSVKKAMTHNLLYLPQKKMRNYQYLQQMPYFINPKHANYFAAAFPKIWGVLSQTGTITTTEFTTEYQKMMRSRPLREAWENMLQNVWWDILHGEKAA